MLHNYFNICCSKASWQQLIHVPVTMSESCSFIQFFCWKIRYLRKVEDVFGCVLMEVTVHASNSNKFSLQCQGHWWITKRASAWCLNIYLKVTQWRWQSKCFPQFMREMYLSVGFMLGCMRPWFNPQHCPFTAFHWTLWDPENHIYNVYRDPQIILSE